MPGTSCPARSACAGVDAGVEDGDDRRARRGRRRRRRRPSRSRQRPLVVVAGIARGGLGGADAVALDVQRRPGRARERVEDRRAGGRPGRPPCAAARSCRRPSAPAAGQDVGPLGGVRAGREGHDVVVGRDRGGRRCRRLGGGGRCRRGRLRGLRVGLAAGSADGAGSAVGSADGSAVGVGAGVGRRASASVQDPPEDSSAGVGSGVAAGEAVALGCAWEPWPGSAASADTGASNDPAIRTA